MWDRTIRSSYSTRGASQKYPEAVELELPKIDLNEAIPWEKI